MTPISEAAAVLAGFVLDHAAWSLSNLPKDELLVPIAMGSQHGKKAPNSPTRDARLTLVRPHSLIRRRVCERLVAFLFSGATARGASKWEPTADFTGGAGTR